MPNGRSQRNPKELDGGKSPLPGSQRNGEEGFEKIQDEHTSAQAPADRTKRIGRSRIAIRLCAGINMKEKFSQPDCPRQCSRKIGAEQPEDEANAEHIGLIPLCIQSIEIEQEPMNPGVAFIERLPQQYTGNLLGKQRVFCEGTTTIANERQLWRRLPRFPVVCVLRLLWQPMRPTHQGKRRLLTHCNKDDERWLNRARHGGEIGQREQLSQIHNGPASLPQYCSQNQQASFVQFARRTPQDNRRHTISWRTRAHHAEQMMTQEICGKVFGCNVDISRAPGVTNR